MKPCPNCRVVYNDDYAGTCVECGAPMGSVQGSNSGGLQFQYARQLQRGERETAMETSMKRGNYEGVPLEQGLVDVARNFVTVDEALLAKLEAQNAQA